MAFIGVDLHTNSFTTCRLEEYGREHLESWQLSPGDLERFCLSLDGDDEIAVEATGNSAWFHKEVAPCVGRVVVVNAKQFQVIRKSLKKTDRNDARALAFFLSKDMLPETRLKSAPESELASLVHTRDVLVKQRTRLLGTGTSGIARGARSGVEPDGLHCRTGCGYGDGRPGSGRL